MADHALARPARRGAAVSELLAQPGGPARPGRRPAPGRAARVVRARSARAGRMGRRQSADRGRRRALGWVTMLLENKNAIVYGAAGKIGGAVARAFARDGARVFLAGRTLANLEETAADIRAHGGMAETAQVDALDKAAVDAHADDV